MLLPRVLTGLRSASISSAPRSDPTWLASTALVELMELYQIVTPHENPSEIPTDMWEKQLHRATEIDDELTRRFTFFELPPKWRYHVAKARAGSSSVVYQGIYHVYRDSYAAKVWNSMRTCRVIAHYIIGALQVRRSGDVYWKWPATLQELAADDNEVVMHGKSFESTLNVLIYTRDEILATVPQMMGYLPDPSGLDVIDRPSRSASACYFVIWYVAFCCCLSAYLWRGTFAHQPMPCRLRYLPDSVLTMRSVLRFLYMAGCIPMNTTHTTQWIVDRLKLIAILTGIQKAEYLAEQLETQSHPGGLTNLPILSGGFQPRMLPVNA